MGGKQEASQMPEMQADRSRKKYRKITAWN